MDRDNSHTSERSPAASNSALPRIDARQLLGAGREVILTLHEIEYRLRLTSKGKLILTK
jgi:hemin uptake protein HemP